MFGFQSIYFFFFLFLIFFVLFLQANIKDKKKYCILCFSLLFLFAGLRGETVGGDLKRYLPEFNNVAHVSFARLFQYGYHEPGYVLYIKLLSLISDNNRAFLIGTSLAAMVGPCVLFYKYSKKPAISILLYYAMGYYTNTFNNVRQSIAMSVAFFIMPYLVERKWWKYVIGCILATCFHYSAIILLVSYPLTYKELNFKRLLFFFLSGIASVYLFTLSAFQYVATFFLTKYDPEELIEERGGTGYSLLLFYLVLLILFTVFYLSKYKSLGGRQRRLLSLFLMFQLLTTIIQMCAPVFSSMMRMAFYFFIPIVTIGVPYIHSLIRGDLNRKIFYIGVFVYAILYMNFVTYAFNKESGSNSQGVIPYVFLNTTIF